MKSLIRYSLFLVLTFLLSACLKENHSVRFKNNFSEQINSVKIGTADIGNVASGATSDYKSIQSGNFTISGTSASGQPLNGTGTITGKGKHKWTVTLSNSGTIGIAEDK
jgi:hypothetical protein